MNDESKQIYDQNFFLKLARPDADTDGARIIARERWNKWRRDAANDGIAVTFSEVDFDVSENDWISFAEFEFGDSANFSKCKWRGLDYFFPSKNLELFECGCAFFKKAVFGDFAIFQKASFGDLANFDGAKFGSYVVFDNANIGKKATFCDTEFGSAAVFYETTFGNEVKFIRTKFGDAPTFSRASFGFSPQFVRSTFGHSARFRKATFGDSTKFFATKFGHGLDFSDAVFEGDASFQQTIFQGRVSFDGAPTDDWIINARRRWKDLNLDKSQTAKEELTYSDDKERRGFGSDRFLELNFSNARFLGKASFARRSFERPADFTRVIFYEPPDFDGITNAGRINFSGVSVRFGGPNRRWFWLDWTKDSTVAVRLRAFRVIAEQTKNHDLERDLYIEERKAERGISYTQTDAAQREAVAAKGRFEHFATAMRIGGQYSWTAVMFFFWLLADYGRSYLRPSLWLGANIGMCRWLYAQAFKPLWQDAFNAHLLDLDALRRYKEAVRMVALGNAVPFVGPLTIDSDIKKFLFCAGKFAEKCFPVPPSGYQLLVVAQNVISIILVFFIGLALRNYFKVK